MNSSEISKNNEVLVDVQRMKLRNLITGFFQIQKTRVAMGNRVVASFNIQMGQEPGTKQEDMDKEAKGLIEKLAKEYKLVSQAYIDKSYVITERQDGNKVSTEVKLGKNDGLEKVINKMHADERSDVRNIRDKVDYELMTPFMELLEAESHLKNTIEKEAIKHPMWDMFFKDVYGCGPLYAAICIAYLDVHKARHASSFWRYAGLDVVPVTTDEPGENGDHLQYKTIHEEDGTEYKVVVCEGRSRKHTEDVTYINKDGKEAVKKGLTYNPVLKTKLIGVMGPNLIKKGGYYAQCYRDYRVRLDNRPDLKDYTDGHKHNMAIRYMVKQFLRDLWSVWRAYEGYEISEPYEVAYLGRKPHKYNAYHERIAQENSAMTFGQYLKSIGVDK